MSSPKPGKSAAAALLALLLLAAPASGAVSDYPLELTLERREGEPQLVARNNGDVPVTLHLPDALTAVEDDGQGAIYVLEARSETVLGEVTPDDEPIRYSFYPGRIDAPAPEDVRCGASACSGAPCYRLPFPDGRAFVISQAHGPAMVSHDNEQNRYAVDFAMPEGVPVVASRGGVVADAVLAHAEGGPKPSFTPRANRITIVHDDGTIARYVHLAPGAPLVDRGTRVAVGTVIGYSGNTGYTGGPHLHFVVARPAIVDGKVRPVSIPFCFFTGAPPRAFAPATGMLPRAEYGPSAAVANPARGPRAAKRPPGAARGRRTGPSP